MNFILFRHKKSKRNPPNNVKVKVKCSRYRPGVAQRVGRCIALLFHDRGTRRGWVVSSTPRPHFTPRGKIRYLFYRRLGGPQDRSGRAENLVPTGIRSRTVQPVVSRYTDWATRPTRNNVRKNILEYIPIKCVIYFLCRYLRCEALKMWACAITTCPIALSFGRGLLPKVRVFLFAVVRVKFR